MGLRKLRRSRDRRREAPSLDEWNIRRQRRAENGLRHPVGAEATCDALKKIVRETHWLSQMCFLERIEPAEISLEPMIAERVVRDLARLNELNSLELYAACLECFLEGAYNESANSSLANSDGPDTVH
ncbi:MAG: hypothetical protein ACK5GN_01800 [Pseudomonadota bacterium]|jgi:hypothetical protein